MKSLNILGVHWKIWLLGGREFTKNRYRRDDCLKSGAWKVCRFKGGLGKKRGGGVFEGGGRGEGWYPDAHYDKILPSFITVYLFSVYSDFFNQVFSAYLETTWKSCYAFSERLKFLVFKSRISESEWKRTRGIGKWKI